MNMGRLERGKFSVQNHTVYVGANPSGALLLYNNAQHIFLFINKVSLFHFSNKIVSNG